MKAYMTLLTAILTIAPTGYAAAQAVVTDEAQMTLYTFDKDVEGKSACYDNCAKNWPPYIGKPGDTKGEHWTLVDRTDGSKQWADVAPRS